MNPEIPNPEISMGTLDPRKFESEKTSPFNAVGEEFEGVCIIVRSSLQYISNSQNNINGVKIMLRIH